jgi:3-phytase
MKQILPLATLTLLSLTACGENTPASQPAVPAAPAAEAAEAPPVQLDAPKVTALRETDAVNTRGDAADDPAIWVDPVDPSRSIIIGTAKKSGLYTYGLDGKTLQFLPEGRLNNVDLRTVTLEGKDTIVVGASDRDAKGIALFRLDPATRQLAVLGERQPSGFTDPYGFCFYKSASGTLYAFMTDKEKNAAQWRIDSAGGKVTAAKVRDIPLATQSEGCVADDRTATVYFAEEDVAVWSFPAEPDQPATATAIVRASDNPKLASDLEGLAIYHNPAGASYLLVSSQGNSSFAVFELGGGYAYRGSFIVTKGTVDGVTETDGIEVVSHPLGADFPKGLFVAQDGDNTDPAANQNFKLVSWEEIARTLQLP